MYFQKLLIAAASLALLGGCATLTPDYRSVGRKLNGPAPEELAARVMTQAAFDGRDDAIATANAAEKRALRRDLVYGMLSASDVDCEDYLIGVSATANQTRAGFGVTGLALSTAGSIATPERSSRLLNALGALTGSTTTALEDTVFAGQDFQIIYTAVQTGRRNNRDQIGARLERGDLDAWGYTSLVYLVTPYHLNCGINYGLQQIAEAVEIQARSRPDSPGVANAAAPGDAALLTASPR